VVERWTLPPALLAVCVLVAGCGGGSSSKPATNATSASASKSASAATTTGSKANAPPPATKVSRTQLVEIANGICKQVKTDFKGGSTGSQFTEIAAVAGEHAAIEERAAEDLAALVPPHGLVIQWGALVAERRALAKELGTLAQAAHEEDAKAIVSLEQSKARRQKSVISLAHSLGVEECASYG
jgi:hypothetical protein